MRPARLLGLVAGLALSADGAHAICHVDPVLGDDATGDGSAGKPWRTLTLAVTRPCQVIQLAPGVYSAASGESFPLLDGFGLLSIRGAPDQASILRTEGATAFELNGFEGSCGVLEGLRIEGSTGSGRAALPGLRIGNCTNGGGPAYSHFQRLHVSGFAAGIEFRPEMWYGPGIGRDSDAVFDANTFVDNAVGLRLEPVRPSFPFRDRSRVFNNRFEGNDVGIEIGPGSGDAATLVFNNLILRSAGSAIVVRGNANGEVEPEIVNNILALGGGVAIDDALGSPSLIDANCFWSNQGANWVVGAAASPGGNLGVDPQFVDFPGGDYHLAPGSPLIDRGVDRDAPPFDRDRLTRPLDGGSGAPRCDVGPYESARFGALRRAEVAQLAPLTPARSSLFPFTAANPLTPVLLPRYDDGARDPDADALYTAPRFYQAEGSEVLRMVKDLASRSVVFYAD